MSGGSYLFEYYLKDHLGNNRSGFAAGTNVTVPNFSADYYPFGMQYWQNIRPGTPKNNYLYNGKELQDGLQLYDYGARLYDPVIGRWGTMDPFAEVHHGYNPHNYVLNNQMSYMDPLGLDTLGVNSHDEVPAIAVEGDVLVDSEGTSSTLLRTVPITVDAPVFGPNVSSPILDGIQTGLDVVGLIPGFGEVADGINAAIYASRGDYVNAGLSLAAMVPLAGMAASGGKLGIKAAELARIQNAATRINKPISVVGSRASGRAGAYSDWDYVIEGGLNSREWSKIKNSLPGARSTLIILREILILCQGRFRQVILI